MGRKPNRYRLTVTRPDGRTEVSEVVGLVGLAGAMKVSRSKAASFQIQCQMVIDGDTYYYRDGLLYEFRERDASPSEPPSTLLVERV